MFYRYEHYMSISHMALIVNMEHMNRDTKRHSRDQKMTTTGSKWTLWKPTSHRQLFSKFDNFYKFFFYKLSRATVWCHLTKWLRHLTRVPNFFFTAPFIQLVTRIYFVYIQSSSPYHWFTHLNFPIWLTFPLKDFNWLNSKQKNLQPDQTRQLNN